ncbi:MAG: twin-arginine translocase TatA/TatE family subunit [Candidatus Limnocylindrales bacterium]
MGLPGDRSEVSAATMPFGIGPVELIIVLVIALLVLGPGKLPDVGAALGKSIREFRKAATEVEEATRLEAKPAVTAPTATPTPAATPTPSASPIGPAPAVTPVAAAPGADAPTEPQA